MDDPATEEVSGSRRGRLPYLQRTVLPDVLVVVVVVSEHPRRVGPEGDLHDRLDHEARKEGQRGVARDLAGVDDLLDRDDDPLRGPGLLLDDRGRAEDLDVARVHSGDPSIYGATAEQMRRLDTLGIDYDITPGVSAYAAAAAELKTELTLPEIAQTVHRWTVMIMI